jgi:hypothetical protein
MKKFVALLALFSLIVLTQALTSSEEGQANFRAIDTDGDGQFSVAEIEAGGEGAGLSAEGVQLIAAAAQKNGGSLTEDELYAAIWN